MKGILGLLYLGLCIYATLDVLKTDAEIVIE